jgi:hypothetical protein
MRGPSPDHLLTETARLAYHFHWPLDTILDLEHADRRRFLTEAGALAGVGSHRQDVSAEPLDAPYPDALTQALADLAPED